MSSAFYGGCINMTLLAIAAKRRAAGRLPAAVDRTHRGVA